MTFHSNGQGSGVAVLLCCQSFQIFLDWEDSSARHLNQRRNMNFKPTCSYCVLNGIIYTLAKLTQITLTYGLVEDSLT